MLPFPSCTRPHGPPRAEAPRSALLTIWCACNDSVEAVTQASQDALCRSITEQSTGNESLTWRFCKSKKYSASVPERQLKLTLTDTQTVDFVKLAKVTAPNPESELIWQHHYYLWGHGSYFLPTPTHTRQTPTCDPHGYNPCSFPTCDITLT